MELELKKGCFDAFDAGTEQILTQEETAETIVPDYCPDIARIIATEVLRYQLYYGCRGVEGCSCHVPHSL
ncbi:MAG: hypothetical protein J6N52_14255 [Clostridia bacterium]|nr:hypothetical protein [Clostridia bacterium]